MDLIDRLIAREGGAKVTKDPDDPGGTTKFGISQRAYPQLDIENISYAEARDIYLNDYVIKPGFHLVSDLKTREMLVDFGVHSGPVTAIKQLQKILGMAPDGKFGPKTLAAIDTLVPFALHKALTIARVVYLARQIQSNPVKIKYLTGWLSRVLSLL